MILDGCARLYCTFIVPVRTSQSFCQIILVAYWTTAHQHELFKAESDTERAGKKKMKNKGGGKK